MAFDSKKIITPNGHVIYQPVVSMGVMKGNGMRSILPVATIDKKFTSAPVDLNPSQGRVAIQKALTRSISSHIKNQSSVVSPSIGSSETTIKKRHKPSKGDRLTIWATWIGLEKGIAKCPLCQNCDLRQGGSEWEVSHILAHARGGPDNLTNYRPLCRTCNSSMGTLNMKEYCKNHIGAVERLKL